MMDHNEALKQLGKFGQKHVLKYWNELSDGEQENLLRDVSCIDLDEVTKKFGECLSSNDAFKNLDDKMRPLPPNTFKSVSNASPGELNEYSMKTFEAISNGKLAVILLAGGQGTRLGVNYPKGMFNVGLLSGKTLFQLQAERILKLQKLSSRYGDSGQEGSIVWYIMTSPSTMQETQQYFENNDYFGLSSKSVIFFEQYTLPCMSFDGKILLQNKHSVAKAPDGNGGIYRALMRRGVLQDMRERGIKYIHLYCVDNILVKVADPHFCGYCIHQNVECGNKVVAKESANEAVGITCLVDEKLQVVEYSEISKDVAQLRDVNNNGSLVYGAANICNHFFTFDFLQRVCHNESHVLKYHIAKKKISFIDVEKDVEVEKPETPNGIKMEKFVFDVFPLANSFAVWECNRESEFAPLKNGSGEKFTPEYCKQALFDLHFSYLKDAGFEVEYDKECEFEISPLVSYAGENLSKLSKLADPKICSPYHLREDVLNK